MLYIASSKQRARLRQAISADHTKLKKLIQQYNTVSVAAAVEPGILEEDIFSGQFTWSQLTSKAYIIWSKVSDFVMIFKQDVIVYPLTRNYRLQKHIITCEG